MPVADAIGMSRLVAAVCVASLLTGSACTMTSGQRTGFIAGGAGLTAVGLISMGANDNFLEGNYDEDGNQQDDGGTLATVSLISTLVGTIMLASALASDPPGADDDVVASGPQPVFLDGPPASFEPAAAALPARETTPIVLRMAYQVRNQAARGDCTAAWKTQREIEARDLDYGLALRVSAAMAPCQ